MEERIQRTMKALERNKIKPYYVKRASSSTTWFGNL